MNKKTIILAIAGILILVILTYILVVFSGKKNNQTSGNSGESSSDQMTHTSTFSDSSFPSDSGNASINTVKVPKNLPPNVSNLQINDTNSQSEIKKAFDSFISQSSSEKIRWTIFSDSEKNIVLLSTVAKNLGLNIKSSLLTLLDSTDYEFFKCSSSKDFGVQLTVKNIPNYSGDEFDNSKKFMKDWEETILPDTSSIIFPNTQFNSEQLKQTLTFRDGKYRYASVTMPDKTVKSINYGLIGNYMVISSSPECLDIASAELISPSE